jgi:hypothetical protein
VGTRPDRKDPLSSCEGVFRISRLVGPSTSKPGGYGFTATWYRAHRLDGALARRCWDLRLARAHWPSFGYISRCSAIDDLPLHRSCSAQRSRFAGTRVARVPTSLITLYPCDDFGRTTTSRACRADSSRAGHGQSCRPDSTFRKRVILSLRARQAKGAPAMRPTFAIGSVNICEPPDGILGATVKVRGRACVRAVALWLGGSRPAAGGQTPSTSSSPRVDPTALAVRELAARRGCFSRPDTTAPAAASPYRRFSCARRWARLSGGAWGAPPSFWPNAPR